ncbi:MAG: 5'/3'-nucleotidase SurE [Gammaproteobacteria bacterium]|jgi:5'-nucleotidase|nr:5'/3'-nucleotidase SurE [Gammaproteobacteria bacterium]MBT3723802.1 5'/3'-nucleotidase SurE [Gammaproteobacteria bacterium]MBT4078155.1 5'/3'-nucleotidase SurE [Gammaproteobacteria bacterium]MBT4196404.1 5'/3'-nucleotidase SurE [Gammaproteobacteria bacterium]MBT4448175.1 5'/3'-nucleotidase SurE [Gammaproteobacteria bacterium]
MHILLSNDDGYLAPGLKAIADELSMMSEITVVAPDRNRSGASNSLTLQRPLRAQMTPLGFYKVDGTPTDCVHLALTGLLTEEPDMVVSGINSGANLGDDVIYSGTVAAATEGRFLGLPALAVSLASRDELHFDTAAKATGEIIRKLLKTPLPEDTILNINVPDLPWPEIKGFQATRLGFRHRAEPVVQQRDPYDQKIYWVGPAGLAQDAGEGTDFYAVKHGYVSVTPLQIDLTRHEGVKPLQNWLDNE